MVFPNHINGGRGAFGPFPYQSNGAQYLNLMWPVMLGFWWSLRRRKHAQRKPGQKVVGDSYVMILIFTVVVASAVVLTQSRAGALILFVQVIAVVILNVFLIGGNQAEKQLFCYCLFPCWE